MKKLIFSILGGILFGALCIGVTWLLGSLFGPLYQGEEESTRNFKIFLFALLASIVIGAILGFLLGKKETNK